MMNNIKILISLVKRNIKLYFKDKMSFFLSLISPLVLLILFVTFLKNVYVNSLLAFIPEGITLDASVINGFAGGWLISSIVGVCCVTIAFCSNIVMVNDKINRNIVDFEVTPVKKSIVSLSYFLANFLVTMLICMITLIIGFLYIASVGWYISFIDILLIVADTLLIVIFGSLLSGIIMNLISSPGGMSAVVTLVSSMYGFVCGAYMPISQFATGVKNVVSLNPGTYGTIILRKHFMSGAIRQIEGLVSQEMLDGIIEGFDGKMFFFGNEVSELQMFIVLGAVSVVLLVLYILMVYLKNNKSNKKKDKAK